MKVLIYFFNTKIIKKNGKVCFIQEFQEKLIDFLNHLKFRFNSLFNTYKINTINLSYIEKNKNNNLGSKLNEIQILRKNV